MLRRTLKKRPFSAFIILPLFFTALPFSTVPTKATSVISNIALSSAALSQGNLITLRITANKEYVPIKGLFRDERIDFFKDKDSYSAFIGAAVNAEDGINLLQITLNKDNKETAKAINKFYPIIIEKKEFGISRITVNKNMVTPNKKELQRIAREKKRIEAALSKATTEKLWHGAFIRPVKGSVSSAFGKKRFLNNQPRSPHSGLDLRSPSGTKILAPNSGLVILTGNHYFSGKTVILDHGGGLLSFYYHMSRINVREGDMVKKGKALGLVGSSGRSTGPHLHWGVTLNNTKASPLSLITATKKLAEDELISTGVMPNYSALDTPLDTP
jgi:murein DD-endopeptidase MepM/ murein hydrolase activator NlpD